MSRRHKASSATIPTLSLVVLHEAKRQEQSLTPNAGHRPKRGGKSMAGSSRSACIFASGLLNEQDRPQLRRNTMGPRRVKDARMEGAQSKSSDTDLRLVYEQTLLQGARTQRHTFTMQSRRNSPHGPSHAEVIRVHVQTIPAGLRPRSRDSLLPKALLFADFRMPVRSWESARFAKSTGCYCLNDARDMPILGHGKSSSGSWPCVLLGLYHRRPTDDASAHWGRRQSLDRPSTTPIPTSRKPSEEHIRASDATRYKHKNGLGDARDLDNET
ncbi:uncharacterized protein C8Q71DRAFT_727568 [Rhodofomes roseus]|uniref:Uncharacterized protein n=1 Tax=Rhodofomes roseus TaxID=34475 RepID=A0ABQ8K107_9APHY|nr:uncharacterized protein C8Q71DRAFT_727568 [Rhodofomes roseus]KAH9830333.1 hypothetical protein C8Q71DRAFT_727568 [Rhodofomes roseus]